MTRRLLALALSAALASLAPPASASSIFTPETVFPTPTTPVQFPGDIANFTAWYGVRAYSSAVAATGTQKALDLRRVSDNATCTALIATDGTLDLTVGTPCNSSTQTVTAWIGASTARVSKFYDQTNGNACGGASCDVVQATAANQPLLLLTGCGGSGTLPCIQIGPSQGGGILSSPNTFTPNASANISISNVGSRSQGVAQLYFIRVTDGTPRASVLAHAAGNWDCMGDANSGGTDATWHVGNCSITSGTSNTLFNIDGSETTGTSSPSSAAGHIVLLWTISTGGANALQLGETGFQDNIFWSLGTRTALCHNQRLYWGTGGSC
jgi:hypothetical protein